MAVVRNEVEISETVQAPTVQALHEKCVTLYLEGYQRPEEAVRLTPGLTMRRARQIYERGVPESGLKPVPEEAAERGRRNANSLYQDKLIKAQAGCDANRLRKLREAEEAAEDALQQRVKDLKLARNAAGAAIALASIEAELFQAGKTFARVVLDAARAVEAGELELRPQDALRYLDAISKFSMRKAEIAKMAIELERLVVGDPTSIVGVKAVVPDQEDAARWWETAEKLWEQERKRKGMIEAVPVDGESVRVDADK